MKTLASSRLPPPGHEEEIDSEGTWAISYGDMVTLLLCFFILFFQIKPAEENVTRIQQGLSDKLVQKSIAQVQTGGGGGVETMSAGKGQEPGISLELLKRLNGVPHKHGNKIIVEFPGISFFPSGGTEITLEGQKALEEFSRSYQGFEANHVVGIRAFTDPRAVRRGERLRYKDNLELSALRSISTMRSLVKSGIPMADIRLGGYGELKLTAKELEKYLVEREKERVAAAVESFNKEKLRLERVIESHRKNPMEGNRKNPRLSKKQLGIIALAERKIAAVQVNLKKFQAQESLRTKDHAFYRDKLARTVVLAIEPKGDRQ